MNSGIDNNTTLECLNSKEYPNVDYQIEEKDVASNLKVVYDDDINIIDIHKFVCRNFVIKRNKIPELEQERDRLNQQSTSYHLTVNQQKILKKKAKHLDELVVSYKSDQEWNIYISKCQQILLDYFNIMSNRTKGILTIGQKDKDDNLEIKRKRLDLIHKYFYVLSDFFHIEEIRSWSLEYPCSICSKPFDNNNLEEESDHYICDCGNSYYIMSKEISYHDTNSTSPKSTLIDDTNSNFIDTINKFTGKNSNYNIPKYLFDQFDDYLRKHNNHIGSYYISLPIEPRKYIERIGNTHNTTVSMLINMLKNTNNSIYYEDINIIGHLYFGWLLPNLDKWFDDIVTVYKMTKSVYEVSLCKRTTILNSKILLYFILEYLKIPCSSEDFKLMDTKDSVDNYREIWKIMSNDPEVIKYRDKFFKKHKIRINKIDKIEI